MKLPSLKLTLAKTQTGQAGPSLATRLSAALDRPGAMRMALAAVLLLAALLRLNGLHWDGDRKLHPDERFLTSVTTDLQWPDSAAQYFDPQTSTLSPYSLPNMGLYVYGMLPVYIVKYAAIGLDRDNYDAITIVGRVFSALFDIATIGFLFLIGRRLYGKKVGLLAAALLALSVLNIQLAHFYTVDTFANLFVVATIYLLLRAGDSGSWLDYALTGLALGLGLASKVSVLTLAAPIVLALGLSFRQRASSGDVRAALEHTLVRLVTVFAVAALTFRVLQPIAFAGPTFWNWSLFQPWRDDIEEQSKIVAGEVDLPWLQQWTARPLSFALTNIVVWGLGLPLGLAGWAGLGLAVFELVRRRKLEHLLPASYVIVTFLYHATTFVKFMRYFLPIYPFLALLAAYLIAWIWRRALAPAAASGWGRLRAGGLPRWAGPAALALVLGGTLAYALAFSAIYSRPHTRVTASRWMYANIPPGSTIASEHWDDWLPIGGVDGLTAYGDSGMFKSVEMNNYDDDTPEKLNKMIANLSQADYVVLSSNRLYDSIPRLPMRYPMTSRYYRLLFSGELGFERVQDFTSYPTLLGIAIPDQSAEEAFSVYDHPRVQVFKKTAGFDPARARQLLSDGIDWSAVLRLTPRQATATRASLQLSPAEQASYDQAARSSSQGVREDSWGSQAPLPVWFLIVELVGLLALPLTLATFTRLADRGALLSKAVGLLVVGWAAWLLASLKLAPFSAWTIVALLVALALASGWLAYRRRAELLAFVRARWRLLLAEEALFWGLFGLSLWLRWSNPDLWHPGLGGEKPMDLAYLTAITRTPYFPSYDPWFAGGYINYYYFGFVLVATLIHLTGTVPTIAYNLAVPLLFAMTGAGGFVVALNLAEGWRGLRDETRARWGGVARAALLAGLCGALFVAVLGNLGQVQLLWDGVRSLSTLPPEEHPTALGMLARAFDGLSQMLGGQRLNFRNEWWYWNSTRVIPPGEGEAGPINEMPFFTFLFADLHAHMIALPYTLLTIALGLNLVRSAEPLAAESRQEAGSSLIDDNLTSVGRRQEAESSSIDDNLIAESRRQEAEGSLIDDNLISVGRRQEAEGSLIDDGTDSVSEQHADRVPPTADHALPTARHLLPAADSVGPTAYYPWWRDLGEILTLALLALTIGALWPINTWDIPTYTALTTAALACREYARRGRIDLAGAWAVAWRMSLILVAGRLLFLPFHRAYASDYFGAEIWRGSRTPLWAYLVIHGFFLFVLGSYMLAELVRGRGHSPVVRSLRLLVLRPRRAGRAQRLFGRLARPRPSYQLAFAAVQIGLALFLALLLINRVFALIVGLLGLAALLLLGGRPQPRRQLILCMVGLGLALTLMVEIVVLKGDISRMNTVFKFYLQVWVLWATAAAGALPELARLLRGRPQARLAPPPELPEGSSWTPAHAAQIEAWRRANRAGKSRRWWTAFGVLLAACLLYPLTAPPARLRERFDGSTAHTLDGAAYMRAAVYNDDGREIPLEWDRAAIEWLRQNTQGLPTIVEANTPLYRWGSRVSIYTGLPTVIGWDWHQKQQRSVLPGQVIDQRIADVRTIYTSGDPNEALRLLHHYGVRYVYLGALERGYYGGPGLDKFPAEQGKLWDKVYENQQVQIYAVR